MAAAENKELIRQVFDELSSRNVEAWIASFADDVSWTIKGTTQFSRTFEGKQALVNDLMRPLLSQVDGQINITPHRFIAEDDLVVVEANGQAMTRSGKPYNNSYCWVFRLQEGKIKEVTEYLDTALVVNVFGG
jgi:ketosteroid isomerase-like protein